MHLALTIFPTEYAIAPDELAVAAEERGFESLWVAEHSHIPASRDTPWPGGADLPQMYYDTMDPFVWLTAAACATTKIKLATGICLVIQRDPIHTAKSVTSLDRISNGRFLFGVGGGWNVEEMNNHGTRFEGRWKLLREKIEAMKAIWTEEQAEYHGEHVDFDPIFANPKPIQKPHPPIHVGGVFPGGARRAIRYADGWMPIAGRGEDMTDHIPAYREMAKEAGRNPDEMEFSIFAGAPDAEVVKRHADAGVTRHVFGLPPAGREQILPYLDKLAALA